MNTPSVFKPCAELTLADVLVGLLCDSPIAALYSIGPDVHILTEEGDSLTFPSSQRILTFNPAERAK